MPMVNMILQHVPAGNKTSVLLCFPCQLTTFPCNELITETTIVFAYLPKLSGQKLSGQKLSGQKLSGKKL